MKQEDLDKTLNIIEAIEKSNSEMEKSLLDMAILSRNDMLKEITQDIITKNSIFQEPEFHKEKVCETDISDNAPSTINSILDGLISNIKKNPSKRVIYLRLFLDRFHEISDQDKNVILQSIKDENVEELKEKMIPLISVFKLEL